MFGEALDKFRLEGNYGDVLSFLAIDLLSKNLIKSKIGVGVSERYFKYLLLTLGSPIVHSWLAHGDTMLDNQRRL